MKTATTIARQKKRGFSLPEVALSIAVAGIALMSVVGLLPGLLDADRGSGINSVLSSLTTQAMGELQAQPYEPPPRTKSFLFSEGGVLVQDAAKARYECKVSLVSLAQGVSGGTTGASLPDPGTHCSLVTLEFSWPVGTTSKLNRRVIHATLAQQ